MLGLLSYLVFFLCVALVFAIAALGLNLQWGFTGLFNAGVVGFYAVGGYTMAILTGPDRPELVGGFGLPFVEHGDVSGPALVWRVKDEQFVPEQTIPLEEMQALFKQIDG